MDIKRLQQYINDKPKRVLSVPAVLCFLQFISNSIDVVKSCHIDACHIDNNMFMQLLSSADGFETVLLCIIMLAIKSKKD